MRYSLVILAAVAISFTGCVQEDSAAPLYTQPNTNYSAPYIAPRDYNEARQAAYDGAGTAQNLPPWQQIDVKVRGTPGIVLTLHTMGGVVRDYTAQRDGVFINDYGTKLDQYLNPKQTMWLTLTSPYQGEIEWTGVQFKSNDARGATWTAPVNAPSDSAALIKCELIAIPYGIG